MTTKALLNELNAFRAANGLKPLSSWKPSRHLPMLDAYRTATAALAKTDALKKKRGVKPGSPTTKKALVLAMMRNGGATTDMIVSALQISKVAAQSLVNDVRRMGVTVTRDGDTYRAGA